jgi:hypothetical protein
MRIVTVLGSALMLSAVLSLAGVPVHASDLDGILVPCGKNKMCPWVKTKAEPPKGWVEDKEWTERYQAVLFFLGGDQSDDKPLIYVRTLLAEPSMGLDAYIKNAQSRWKNDHASAIEPQPDVKRNGKPTFKVFLYKNPSVKNQAFELTAFTGDRDPSHGNRAYFQEAVLVAPNQATLAEARAAFEELLQRL